MATKSDQLSEKNLRSTKLIFHTMLWIILKHASFYSNSSFSKHLWPSWSVLKSSNSRTLETSIVSVIDIVRTKRRVWGYTYGVHSTPLVTGMSSTMCLCHAMKLVHTRKGMLQWQTDYLRYNICVSLHIITFIFDNLKKNTKPLSYLDLLKDVLVLGG